MICPNLWFGKFISAERGQIDTAITGRRSNEQITEKIMEAIAGDRADGSYGHNCCAADGRLWRGTECSRRRILRSHCRNHRNSSGKWKQCRERHLADAECRRGLSGCGDGCDGISEE